MWRNAKSSHTSPLWLTNVSNTAIFGLGMYCPLAYVARPKASALHRTSTMTLVRVSFGILQTFMLSAAHIVLTYWRFSAVLQLGSEPALDNPGIGDTEMVRPVDWCDVWCVMIHAACIESSIGAKYVTVRTPLLNWGNLGILVHDVEKSSCLYYAAFTELLQAGCSLLFSGGKKGQRWCQPTKQICQLEAFCPISLLETAFFGWIQKMYHTSVSSCSPSYKRRGAMESFPKMWYSNEWDSPWLLICLPSPLRPWALKVSSWRLLGTASYSLISICSVPQPHYGQQAPLWGPNFNGGLCWAKCPHWHYCIRLLQETYEPEQLTQHSGLAGGQSAAGHQCVVEVGCWWRHITACRSLSSVCASPVSAICRAEMQWCHLSRGEAFHTNWHPSLAQGLVK